MLSKRPKWAKSETSSPFEGDVRPFRGQSSIQKSNVSPSWAPPSCHMCQPSCQTATRSRKTSSHPGWRPGHQRETLHLRRVNPPGLGSAKVSWMEHPSSQVQKLNQALSCLCPWWGPSNHLMGFLAPWRSELIISPCVPVQLVPVRRAWSCTSKTSPSMGSLVTGITAMSITFHH